MLLCNGQVKTKADRHWPCSTSTVSCRNQYIHEQLIMKFCPVCRSFAVLELWGTADTDNNFLVKQNFTFNFALRKFKSLTLSLPSAQLAVGSRTTVNIPRYQKTSTTRRIEWLQVDLFLAQVWEDSRSIQSSIELLWQVTSECLPAMEGIGQNIWLKNCYTWNLPGRMSSLGNKPVNKRK
jgi:hypothetical protein